MRIDDRYELTEEIGRGNFGAVFQATELATGTTVAIKIYQPVRDAAGTASLERFKREGQNGMRLQHPNVVKVIETSVSQSNVPYIVMEMLHGRDLDAVLGDKAAISATRARDIAVAVCDALAAAHALDIVHRDIKPENVFLHEGADGKEVIKVLDLGVAKHIRSKQPNLTADGSIVGTPTYIAPERFRREPFDGRSDVFSVGVLVYRCVTGELPFGNPRSHFMSVVTAVLKDEPRLNFDPALLPKVLSDAIGQALVKDPAKRPDAASYAKTLRDLPL